MSNSERLSQTAASIGGGRGIFNEDALYHEVGLQKAVPELISVLQEEYSNVEFFWKKGKIKKSKKKLFKLKKRKMPKIKRGKRVKIIKKARKQKKNQQKLRKCPINQKK